MAINIIRNLKVLLLIFALGALLFLANTQATTELYDKCEKKFWFKNQKNFKQSIKSKCLKENYHHEKRHNQYHKCNDNDESYQSFIKSKWEKFSNCRCEAALKEMGDLKDSKAFVCYQIARLNKATGEFLGEISVYKNKHSKDSYGVALKYSDNVEIMNDKGQWDGETYRTEKDSKSSIVGEYSNQKYYVNGKIPKVESMNKLTMKNVSPSEFKLTVNNEEDTLKNKDFAVVPFSSFVTSSNILSNQQSENPAPKNPTNPADPKNPAPAENPKDSKNPAPADPAADPKNPAPAENPKDPKNPAPAENSKDPKNPTNPDPAANPKDPKNPAPADPAANPKDPKNPAPADPAANPKDSKNPTNPDPAANPKDPKNPAPADPAAADPTNPDPANNPTDPAATYPADPAATDPTDPAGKNPADPADPTNPTNPAPADNPALSNTSGNQTPQEANNDNNASSGGISSAAIGSIVFGVIIAIGGVFIGYNTYERLRWRRQYRRRQAAAAQQNASLANVPDYNGYGRAY